MYYTLGEAARATGKSKATISRAIKSGRISVVSHENGSFQIDPAELHREFPAVSRDSATQPPMERSATAEKADETGGLHRELDLLRQERERERGQLQETIEDLRRQRDKLTAVVEEQAKSMALLTHQVEAAKVIPLPTEPTPAPPAPSPPEPPKGGRLSRAWSILRGRG